MSLPRVIIQSIDRAETSGGQLFRRLKCIVYKTNKKYYEILTLYEYEVAISELFV